MPSTASLPRPALPPLRPAALLPLLPFALSLLLLGACAGEAALPAQGEGGAGRQASAPPTSAPSTSAPASASEASASQASASQASAAAPRPVRLAPPGRAASDRVVRAIGRLEAGEEADLGFASPGVVARIEVDIGDPVARGQVLARLDTTALDASVAQARDQLVQARRDLERARGLIDRQLIARQQYDDARTRVDVAESAARAAGYAQRYGRIVAAGDGVVLARLADPGEVVAAGQPVLRVSAGGREWRLPVELADRDGAPVRVDDRAEVEIDALPGQRFAARVLRIGGQASARSGAIEVELALEVPAGLDPALAARLRSGLVARARIPLRADTAALQVPVSALIEADLGRGVLFVAEPDAGGALRARRREVRLDGIVAADRTEAGHVRVTAGLPADARVIVAGGAFVQDGDRVRALDAPAAAAGAR